MEELKKQLLEQLMAASEKAGELSVKSIELLEKECPILVQEILRWGFMISLIGFVIGVVGILLCLISLRWNMFIPLVWMVGFFFLCMANLDWLQIKVAPRLFLLEYVARLLK